MLRLPFYVMIALIIVFGGGTWATMQILTTSFGFGAISVGPWRAYPKIQTDKADPYARARRAYDGRLYLGRAEGLEFFAELDSDGNGLSGRCVYSLEGRVPPARFWTFRVTDRRGNPTPAHPLTPKTLQSWRLLQDSEGGFEAYIGRTPHAGNWVSVDSSSPIRFVLTLIDTPAAAVVDKSTLIMPRIERLICYDS